MGGRSTKDLILDTAEALFAEQGFAATSLRSITTAAGVNLASVNYHFGSKEALIQAVFERRLHAMSEERLRRLAALEAASGAAPVALEPLIEAFIAPAMELSRDTARGGDRFIRLLGRSYTEPAGWLQDCVRGVYEPVIDRFKGAFARALPQLPREELYWRMHFMVGVLAYCMAGSDMMRLIASCRLCDPLDSRTLTERLVRFLTAGLNAPVSAAAAPARVGSGGSAPG